MKQSDSEILNLLVDKKKAKELLASLRLDLKTTETLLDQHTKIAFDLENQKSDLDRKIHKIDILILGEIEK